MVQEFGRRRPGTLDQRRAAPVQGDWMRTPESSVHVNGSPANGVQEIDVVDQSLGAWQLERKRSIKPYRYIFAATWVLGLVASFALPDELALIVRVILFGAGLTAVTLGQKRWAARSRKVTETTFEV